MDGGILNHLNAAVAPPRLRPAALGGVEQALPAVGGAGPLLDIALVDQLLEHAGQALLGDVEDLQKVGHA